jgi:hypothetical protein
MAVPEVARACLAALGTQLLSLKQQIVGGPSKLARVLRGGTLTVIYILVIKPSRGQPRRGS